MNVGRCYINVILETEWMLEDVTLMLYVGRCYIRDWMNVWRCYINVILETEWMLEDVILMLY